MVKVYCDGCGKQLKSDYADVINVDFNCYGTANFERFDTRNLCKQCATAVREFIIALPAKESE